MKHFAPGKALALVAAIGAVIALSTPTAAVAAPTDDSDLSRAISFLEENMARFEVPQDLRASLLEKTLSGSPLDADAPGAVPISVDTVTNEYGTFPVKRYADGSFDSAGVSLEVIPDETGPALMEIKNCSQSGGTSGTTYTGCQVYHWTLAHNMWFPVNYTRASGYGAINSMPTAGRGFESFQSCTTEYYGYSNSGGTGWGEWQLACTDYLGSSGMESLGIYVSGASAYSVQTY